MSALALIELTSIVRGIVVADAMVKKADVELRDARSVSPGRYLVRVEGGVGEVKAAYEHALDVAGDTRLDDVFLPNPHPCLATLLEGGEMAVEHDSVGLVECYTSASAVKAVDAAAKAADVDVARLELANQLGGKGWFVFSGELHMVEPALAAAKAAVTPGMLLGAELIARPHPDTGRAF